MAARSLPRLWPAPTLAEVETIAKMADPVLRNLHITQTYHVLTVELSEPLGEDNVSWCAHATWASKTAGFFIRKEVVPALVKEFLERADGLTRSIQGLQDQFLGPYGTSVGVQLVLTRTITEVTNEIARHVAEGNRRVFAELGPLYAVMLDAFRGAEAPGADRLGRILSRLTPGPVEQGGQDLLIRAFTHYHAALTAQDPKARAELIFLANALVGYHEQIRLQEPVAAALNAPLREVFLDCVTSLAGIDLTPNRDTLMERSLRGLFGQLATRLERLWRELSTRTLMRMELPHTALRLGEDIPALTAEGDFPPALLRLEHPELVALMKKLDRTPDDTAGSAARDWGSLADRMNLIVDLFRSRQQERLLFDQPFTYLQVDAFRQGRVPHGRL